MAATTQATTGEKRPKPTNPVQLVIQEATKKLQDQIEKMQVEEFEQSVEGAVQQQENTKQVLKDFMDSSTVDGWLEKR